MGLLTQLQKTLLITLLENVTKLNTTDDWETLYINQYCNIIVNDKVIYLQFHINVKFILYN